MAEATPLDFRSAAIAALTALGFPTLTPAGQPVYGPSLRLEPRLLPNARACLVTISDVSQVRTQSNVTKHLVELDVTLLQRSASAALIDVAAAEVLHSAALATVTDSEFWSALPPVSSSPFPEVEVVSSLDIVGLVHTFKIRARGVLELGFT